MAREIQLSILPHEIPKIRGLEIAARHLPMSSAAGDSYDFIIVDEKHLGIVIADVSGHGLPAALIASMLKVALAAQSPHVFDPARVLAGLNQSLCGKFNPPMLLRRPSTGSGSEVLQNGLLLGLFPEATYSVVKVAVEPDLPCSSEVADSVTSVSRRMIWIFTPGIAAPDGSSVLPISAPVEGDCAQRWPANRSTAQSLLPEPKSRVASIPWSHARSHT